MVGVFDARVERLVHKSPVTVIRTRARTVCVREEP